jgi:hypothetical protein
LPNVLGSEITFAYLGHFSEALPYHALHLPLWESLELSAAGAFCEKPEYASLEMRSRSVGSVAPMVRSAFAHAARMRVNIPIRSCSFSRQPVMLVCVISTRNRIKVTQVRRGQVSAHVVQGSLQFANEKRVNALIAPW